MSTATLKDGSQQVIGYIETHANGKQLAKDARYIIKGYYDPKTNQTRDARYKVVGPGNLLTVLLTAPEARG